MELECDSLKRLVNFTKRGELQSRIDRKNEEIDILKVGLSGIAQSYGYQNVMKGIFLWGNLMLLEQRYRIYRLRKMIISL